MKTLLLALLILLSLPNWASSTFSFDSSDESWGNWGDGIFRWDTTLGHNNPGSLWVSTDWGEIHTLNYQWNDLKPGRYVFTAYVRAKNVQAHPDQASFWHFYDTGAGTVNVFEDLKGSYDWRKVSYTIDVKDKLSIWFRLKSAGQIWIDDISLLPTKSAPIALSLSQSRPLPESKTLPVTSPLAKKNVLLDFDQNQPPHPFPLTAVGANKMGKFSSHHYFNFSPVNFLNGNWAGYERLSLDVYNPGLESVEFFLTLGDDLSTNYWTHQNHKTSLAPGWNKLDFSLLQTLGERGSQRVARALNLGRITKWFIIADPEKKIPQSKALYVDNITLYTLPGPQVPKRLTAFDFTSQKLKSLPGFVRVTTQDIYDGKSDFGFEGAKFWRVEDAIWAPTLLRSSIGLLKGGFRFKIPNGRYRGQIILDRLGYWDVSFWQNRSIMINGRYVFKESRSPADYLKDWLIFESVEPSATDHPYDLFFKKIFRPVDVEFTVTGNSVRFDFEGDATAVSLNSLIIWPLDADPIAQSFLTSLHKWNRQEVDWNSRKVSQSPSLNTSPVSIIEAKLNLSPFVAGTAIAKTLTFLQTAEESTYQLLQLKGEDVVSFSFKNYANEFRFFELVPQYASADLNHETYALYGKYLQPLAKNSLQLKTGELRFVWVEFKKNKLAPGTYKTELLINGKNLKTSLPVSIHLLKEQLPRPDFAVGFFGLDPVSSSYYPGAGWEKLRETYRYQALNLLAGAGFTTFSGLPPVQLIQEGDQWRLETGNLDQLLRRAAQLGMKGPFFSYGGHFPQKLLDGSMRPQKVDEKTYRTRVAELLSLYLTQKNRPTLVHTFSDEAAGYSDRVEEDLKLGKNLKHDFPALSLGGFSGLGEARVQELKRLFDYPFYSNLTAKDASQLKSKWGSYNAAAGNLDDPRYTFGPGLFYARKLGLNHYLEWHTSSVNNYPYFDLDGRESDVMLFLPTSDGHLRSTLKFKLAAEGLSTFRKLTLIEKLSSNSQSEAAAEARKWLAQFQQGKFSSEANMLKPSSRFRFDVFRTELNQHLERLSDLTKVNGSENP